MLLYGLMAIAPAALGTGVLLVYLRYQIRNATREFQQQTQASFQHYRARVEQSTQAMLEDAFVQVERNIQRGLDQQRQRLAQRQEALIGRALRTLNRRVSSSTSAMQHTTHRALKQTLDDTAEQISTLQARALAQLAITATDASRDAIRTQVNQSSLSLTDSLRRQVDGTLQNALTQLTLIAQQPAVREARLQESEWILQALQDREPSYRLLCLRDSRGQRLLTVGDVTPAESALQPVLASLWQQMTASDQPIVGSVVMLDTEAGAEPVIPVLVPVRERGVDLRGAICALIGMDNLNTLIRAFRMGNQGYAMLCASDGLVLAHPDARRVGQRDESFATLVASTLEGVRPRLEEVNHSLVVLAPIVRLNACLIVVQPTEEAFQLATTLQSHFNKARQIQQGALRGAIRQIREQAARQVSQQMSRHQQQLQQTLQQAERQTLSESKHMLNAQHRAIRASMQRLLKTSLRQSQHQLQNRLSQLSQLSDLSRQFNTFTDTLQQRIVEQIINAMLIGLMGVLLLGLLGSVYLYRTLNIPLRTLVETTHAIAGGDLTRRVQLPTGNAPELEQLADSFNHMVDALAKAEAQIIQTSKLASLGTLASGVAHELNQPLAIIRGVAQQTIQMLSRLQSLSPSGGEGTGEGAAHAVSNPSSQPSPQREEGEPKPLSPSGGEGTGEGVSQSLSPSGGEGTGEGTWIRQLLDDMRLIERQTQRMSQIILHLRTFARKPRATREPVNLNTVAENALILLREQLHQRGIELIEEYESNLPPVLGEPNSLEQVVINLLTNARDALEGQPDGRVVIRTRRVQESGREWVELCVQDNGPGVPPDLRMQIFDPFFTTKEPGKGTGLGLSISLEIAQKHGGTLLLGDSPAGACFILRLPAAAQQQHAA